jgi:hypothetical protein
MATAPRDISSQPFGHQAGGPRIRQETLQPPSLSDGHFSTKLSDAVLTAALIVVFGIGALFEFLDQTGVHPAFDGAIQAAGTDTEPAFSAGRDILQNRVSVAIMPGQRHQDVKHILLKRQALFGQFQLCRLTRQGNYYGSSCYSKE